MEAAGVKRVRLLQQVSRHGTRKVTLALESTLPAEVTWGLSAVLQASCGLEGHAPSEKLELLVSLQRNPALLPALMALALPEPPEEPYDVLRPCPPSKAQLRALGKLHRHQAWLCLRNMAHLPENEAVLLQHAPLRALLFHTLQRCFHEVELPGGQLPHLPLSTLELAEAVDDSGGTAESGLGDGKSNLLRSAGDKGGRGRGRVRPGAARGKHAKQAEEARGPSAASPLVITPENSSGPGREVPLLNEGFDPNVHGTAAELLSCLCRQAKLDDLLVRLPQDAGSGLPESVPELCALLAQMLRCGDSNLTLPAIEALARLSVIDLNEAHLHAMFAAEPSIAAVLAVGLDPDADDGVTLHEAVLDVLCVLSCAALPLRLLLARERSLLPRLLSLLSHPTPPSCSRRAAAVLHNLASVPGNHNAFRPYEAGLLGLAMHPPGECGANQGTVLSEVTLELNPTPAW